MGVMCYNLNNSYLFIFILCKHQLKRCLFLILERSRDSVGLLSVTLPSTALILKALTIAQGSVGKLGLFPPNWASYEHIELVKK